MYRNAFTMKLKPGFEAEYKRRHDEIWPELSALLSKSGIHDYSIFLEEDSLTLFAFQKLKEGFDGTAVSNDPIAQKWWAYMADIMETNEDHSPVTKTLSEVFYMD